MEVPKIHLSKAETELMQNASVILTKNRVLESIREMLKGVEGAQLEIVAAQGRRHQELFIISPKISKGEYYEGLPYLILDYPRLSAADDLFFVRIMFWWGHFFTTTLHLSGRHKTAMQNKIAGAFAQLQDYSIGINPNPWVHHFEENNYRSISEMDAAEFRQACESGSQLKIATRISLSEWAEAPQVLLNQWKYLLEVCGLIA